MENSKINLVMYKNTSAGKVPGSGYVDILEEIRPNQNFQVKIFVTCQYFDVGRYPMNRY